MTSEISWWTRPERERGRELIDVRAATAEDAVTVARLMNELDRFYGGTEVAPVECRAGQVKDAVFGGSSAAQVLLACDGDAAVGLATYSFLWPAEGVTASLYLKELFVVEASRCHGIGELLMRHLARIATQRGCSRMEWTTDSPNTQARAFYDRLGAPVQETKVFYRLDGEAVARLAE